MMITLRNHSCTRVRAGIKGIKAMINLYVQQFKSEKYLPCKLHMFSPPSWDGASCRSYVPIGKAEGKWDRHFQNCLRNMSEDWVNTSPKQRINSYVTYSFFKSCFQLSEDRIRRKHSAHALWYSVFIHCNQCRKMWVQNQGSSWINQLVPSFFNLGSLCPSFISHPLVDGQFKTRLKELLTSYNTLRELFAYYTLWHPGSQTVFFLKDSKNSWKFYSGQTSSGFKSLLAMKLNFITTLGLSVSLFPHSD